jgi:Tfp pilus assembly PilM family ATPase
MPRILAIDWDRTEVRGLLMSSGATGTSVAGAWTASLATADPAGLSGKQIGSRLAAAISGEVSGKVTTLVGVGRDNVQIKLLSLPPAPADELPELVRFQAEREFTALGSEAALDFIPLSGDAQTQNQVLALSLSPAGMAEAREICEALGIELDRVPVRGCAAAALASRAGKIKSDEIALIVNPLAEEADLVVQSDDKVILLRTVRWPDSSQPEARQRALIGEIRRTIAAVRQQLTDRQVSKIILCGNEQSIVAGKTFGDELDQSVALVDPVSQAPAGLGAKGVPPESLGRFASVLGMALGEADRQRPIVDFANVRKKAEARRFSRVHALAAAAVGVAALWFALYLWHQISEPTRQLADLQNRIHEAESQAEMYKDVTAQAATIERWAATDVNWLDELEQFARRVRPQPLTAKEFNVGSDAVMTQLTIRRATGANPSGGQMDFDGVAKGPDAVADLEQRLRDQKHRVSTGGGKQDKTMPGYNWSFGLQMKVPRPDETAAEAPKK